MVEARNDEFITVHQLDISCGARVSQRLVEVDTHGISGTEGQFLKGDRVTGIARRLTSHTDDRTDTCLLILIHLTHESGTTDVSTLDDTTSSMY